MPPKTPIYQIRITLRYIDPPIWRRVQVRGDTSLDRLHEIIQASTQFSNRAHDTNTGPGTGGALQIEASVLAFF